MRLLMIEDKNYWYNGQLRKYLLQFMAIFHGLQVQTGRQNCDMASMVPVQITAGAKDRVVAAVGTGNTQNRVFALPIMAANITSMTISDARRKAPDMVDRRTFLPVAGIFPDDLRTIERVMPVPYDLQIELAIFASNTEQLHQILEQILCLFNPELQIQVTTGTFDWTRLTHVKLVDIANEENYPLGTDRSMISWTLMFEIPIFIGIPMGVRDEIIRRVRIRIGTVDSTIGQSGFTDEEGNWVPYDHIIADIDIKDRPPSGPPVPPALPIPGYP